MKGRRFIINGIMSEYFHSKTKSPIKLALFMYGFPASVGKNDLTKILTDDGYGVIQPHYKGTYDSEGEMNPLSAIETIKTLVTNLNGTIVELNNLNKINIPNDITLIIGYSFGGFTALHTSVLFKKLKSIILISPTITFSDNQELDMGVLENGELHLQYVKRTRPLTYRLNNDKMWKDLYDGLFDKKIPKNNSSVNILSIFGLNDSTFNFEITQNNYDVLLKKWFVNGNIETIYNEKGGHKLTSLLNSEVQGTIETYI